MKSVCVVTAICALIASDVQGTENSEHQELIAGLSSDDADVRIHALRQLAQRVGPDCLASDAVAVLAEILQCASDDNSIEYRLTADLARQIIASGGDPEARMLPPLVRIIESTGGRLQLHAILALAEYSEAAASAGAALSELASENVHANPFLCTTSAYAWSCVNPIDVPPLKLLQKWCHEESDVLRLNAVVNIGRCGTDAAVAEVDVLRLLWDPDAAVRTAAANAHFKLTGETDIAVQVLTATMLADARAFSIEPHFFNEWVPDHRMFALEALADMRAGGPLVVSAFRKVLKSDDKILRFVAVQKVDRLDRKTAIQLRDSLADVVESDESELVRRGATEAMRRIQESTASPDEGGVQHDNGQ